MKILEVYELAGKMKCDCGETFTFSITSDVPFPVVCPKCGAEIENPHVVIMTIEGKKRRW